MVKLYHWITDDDGNRILAYVVPARHDGEQYLTPQGRRVFIFNIMDDNGEKYSIAPYWEFA
jgi:hypothetical protein